VADPVDEVYGAPLDDFVGARARAAAALKAAGEAERAAEVAALRKPAVHVWALNQAARSDPAGARALAAAAEEVAAVQARRASGDLLEATERLRSAGDALVREAHGRLEAAGRTATDATRDRVAALVRLVAADEAARQALVEGRLLEEPEQTGFGSLGVVGDVAAQAPRGRPRREEAAEEPSKAELERRRRRERHEAHVRELEEALAEAEREAKAADRAVKDAERAAAQAARTRDSLARSLERLRARGSR
jgi:hypothetical protein